MSKNIFITGSTDGIGKQSAIELSKMDHHVIIHGRDENAINQSLEDIGKESGRSQVAGFTGEFEKLSEVKKLANSIRNNYDKLDILINNAGVFQKEREVTEDGYEKTFQVNYLAHFLLTHLLMDLLENGEDPRVVNVSSMVHATAIDFDNLQGEKSFGGSAAYGLSKLCNVLFTYKLAREKKDSSLTCNCLHPGVISTKLLKQNYGDIGAAVDEGADNILYAATSDKIDHVSGKYFVNKMPQSSATVTYEHQIQERLWDVSKEMVKDYLH